MAKYTQVRFYGHGMSNRLDRDVVFRLLGESRARRFYQQLQASPQVRGTPQMTATLQAIFGGNGPSGVYTVENDREFALPLGCPTSGPGGKCKRTPLDIR